jgi:single-strand DNA-binding protein
MINKVTLVGNTGKDPEIRTTTTGKKVATFSLATSEKRKDASGETLTVTSWHNIVAWSPLAEVAELYVKKGQLLYIDGRINYRTYESGGVTKYVTEIVANTMQMLGAKKSEDIAVRPEPQPTSKPEPQAQPDDDLPF